MLIANTDVGLGFTLYLIVLSFSMEAVHIRTHEEVIVSHMVEQLRVTEKEACFGLSFRAHMYTHRTQRGLCLNSMSVSSYKAQLPKQRHLELHESWTRRHVTLVTFNDISSSWGIDVSGFHLCMFVTQSLSDRPTETGCRSNVNSD